MVASFEVHLFVDQLLASVGSWPTAGTPAWVDLDDDDPRKAAAVLSDGVRWALRIDTEQAARAQASRDVHGGDNWRRVGGRMLQHSPRVYIPRKKKAS